MRLSTVLLCAAPHCHSASLIVPQKYCTVPQNIARYHKTLHGTTKHCTVPQSIARYHKALHSTTKHCTVPQGNVFSAANLNFHLHQVFLKCYFGLINTNLDVLLEHLGGVGGGGGGVLLSKGLCSCSLHIRPQSRQ